MIKIIAIIFSCLSGLLLVLSSFGKTKRQIFGCQIFDTIFNIIANFLLKGYTGIITHSVSLIRNTLAFSEKMTIKKQIILSILLVVIGIMFNNRGIIGFFPIIASLEYTMVGCYKNASVKLVKISLWIRLLLWAIYELYIFIN